MIQPLIDAVHDLINEIETTSFDGLSYTDWAGEEKLQQVKELSGWSSKVLVYTPNPKWFLDDNNKLVDNPDYVESHSEEYTARTTSSYR